MREDIIANTTYECPICHKRYSDKSVAQECLESHDTRCICEKYEKFHLSSASTFHEDVYVKTRINFKEKQIERLQVYTGNEIPKDYEDTLQVCAEIEYCPFCGRKL